MRTYYRICLSFLESSMFGKYLKCIQGIFITFLKHILKHANVNLVCSSDNQKLKVSIAWNFKLWVSINDVSNLYMNTLLYCRNEFRKPKWKTRSEWYDMPLFIFQRYSYFLSSFYLWNIYFHGEFMIKSVYPMKCQKNQIFHIVSHSLRNLFTPILCETLLFYIFAITNKK